MSTLNFYLAARYSRREELCGYRSDLEARGHAVPARWLLGEEQQGGGQVDSVEGSDEIEARSAAVFATVDIEDLTAADVLVAFTEPPGVPGASRGGRHVETGIAIGLRHVGVSRQHIFVVGPLENVFHALPEVDGMFDDWAGFLGFVDGGGLSTVGSAISSGRATLEASLGRADWVYDLDLEMHVPVCSQPVVAHHCGNGPLEDDQISTGDCGQTDRHDRGPR